MGTKLTWNMKQQITLPEMCLQCGISHFSFKGQDMISDVNIHAAETAIRSFRQTLLKGRARHKFIDVSTVHSEQLQSKKTYR